MNLFRSLGWVIGTIALVASGAAVMPGALTVFKLRAIADDPVALSELRVRQVLTPDQVRSEIHDAIVAEDEELALSFMALAEAQSIPVADTSRAEVAELQRTATQRAARDFGRGFLSGTSDTLSGLAGGLTADMVGYGDMRDLYQEGSKLVSGEVYDEIVLGMSAIGLAVSVATIASLGATAPARGGVSALKTAKKAGRISGPLTTTLTTTAREIVDADALKGAITAARRLDLEGTRVAARASVRPASLTNLRGLADDTATLFARTGPRGTMQALSIAENADEVRRASRLANTLGSKTRAVLKVLGRGALVLGQAFLALLNWAWAGVIWMLGLALFARRLGTALGRMNWHSLGLKARQS